LADVVKGNPSGPPALATAPAFFVFAFTKLLKKALTLKAIRTPVRPFFLRFLSPGLLRLTQKNENTF
jgi:hypothetical protein